MRRLSGIFTLVLLAGASATLAQDVSGVEQSLSRANFVLNVVIVAFPLLGLAGGYIVYRRLQVLHHRIAQLEDQARTRAQASSELESITSELQRVKKQLEETNKRVRETEAIKAGETRQIQTQVTQSLEKLAQSVAQQRDESANAIRALALLPVGERQYRVKDIEGALDTYNRALELDDDNATIHYRLGYVYTQSGRLQEGLAHFTRSLAIDPDFIPAIAGMGYCRRRMAETLPAGPERERQFDEAEAMLLKALSSSPRSLDEDGESWWGILGGLYRERGKTEQAIKAYENAAAVTPYSSYPLNNLALLYMRENGIEAMLETYRRVERLARSRIQATPDDYWAYADLLVARIAQGKTQEAEDALKFVIELLPTQLSYAAESLIETLEELGKALGPEATHVPTVISYIREAMTGLYQRKTSTDEITKPVQTFTTPVSTARVVLQNRRDTIKFPNGQEATLVHVSDEDNAEEAVKLLGLTAPQPAIFMLVGAMDMQSKEMAMTRPIIEDGLAKFANERQIAIVDGGTATGVMQLIGDARRNHSYQFPLIGVAPSNQVKYPGHDNPTGYELDTGHSHFVLTLDGDFGDETDMIIELSEALTGDGKKPRLGMIINGGDIVRQEVYRLATEPDGELVLLVLEGSGRFADELAAAKRTGKADSDVLKTIVEKGKVELISVSEGPEALRERLGRFFAEKGKKKA